MVNCESCNKEFVPDSSTLMNLFYCFDCINKGVMNDENM